MALFAAMALVVTACGSVEPSSTTIALDPEVFEAMASPVLGAEEVNDIVAGRLSPPAFNSDPATSGPYADGWARCGVYKQEIPDIYLVHSLRRGAVVINYQPALELAEVAALEELVASIGENVLTAPRPGLGRPIVLAAWTTLLPLDEVDGPTVRAFVDQYAQSAPDNQECPLEVDETK